MQVDSIYHKDFITQKPLPKLAFKPAESDNRLNKPNLAVDLSSTYLGDYAGRMTPTSEYSHPKDSLKFNGPSNYVSTYKD
jgi:hypothetical protein